MENTNTDARKAAEGETSNITVTFGLTNKHIEIIEKRVKAFDGALYSTGMWDWAAQDIGWSPLAAALRYFKYLNTKDSKPATLDKGENIEQLIEVASGLFRSLNRISNKNPNAVIDGDLKRIERYREVIDKIPKYNSFKIVKSLSEQPEAKPTESEQVETLINAKNFFWNKSSEKPLVDWNENHTRWVQSSHCPSGEFMAGLYVGNKETGKCRFEFYKVVLTEDGLREVANDDNFDTGYEIDDFEYWAEVPKPSTH